jgi:hypothetical protein
VAGPGAAAALPVRRSSSWFWMDAAAAALIFKLRASEVLASESRWRPLRPLAGQRAAPGVLRSRESELECQCQPDSEAARGPVPGETRRCADSEGTPTLRGDGSRLRARRTRVLARRPRRALGTRRARGQDNGSSALQSHSQRRRLGDFGGSATGGLGLPRKFEPRPLLAIGASNVSGVATYAEARKSRTLHH